MSTVTTGTVSSTAVAAAYNVNFDSLYNAELKPQVWGELIKRYGKGIGLLDILFFATDRTIPVKGSSETVFEEGAWHRLVTLDSDGIATTSSKGDDITFKLATSDYDTNNKCYLAVDDQIIIPPAYLNFDDSATYEYKKYQVVSTSGSTNDITYTATPLDDGTAITTKVPGSTELAVTPGNYAPGSDGASAKSVGWYTKTYYTAIKKAAWHIEGSSQSNERYIEHLKGGGKGVMTRATIKADFDLTKGINDELLIGEVPDNLTMANRDSDDNSVRGTAGLWPTLGTYGMRQLYTPPYDITDFDDIKDCFISQGVINTNAVFGMGSTLYKYIENSGLDFLKDYSGGTDLMRSFNTMGIEFKAIKKNTINFMLQEVASFSDPTSLGASAYTFKESGFIVPETDVTVRKSLNDPSHGIKMKNLLLGYKSYNGENRTRVVKVLPGMASISGLGGNIAVDSYDDIRGHMLSEFMLLFLKPNQGIRVMPDDILG